MAAPLILLGIGMGSALTPLTTAGDGRRRRRRRRRRLGPDQRRPPARRHARRRRPDHRLRRRQQRRRRPRPGRRRPHRPRRRRDPDRPRPGHRARRDAPPAAPQAPRRRWRHEVARDGGAPARIARPSNRGCDGGRNGARRAASVRPRRSTAPSAASRSSSRSVRTASLGTVRPSATGVYLPISCAMRSIGPLGSAGPQKRPADLPRSQ